jgi:ankyrin repeat protein
MLAAMHGLGGTAAMLIEHGADLEARDNEGSPLIMYAILNDHSGIVRLLLERGADPDARTARGVSAMQIAYNYGHVRIGQIIEHASWVKRGGKETDV